LNVRAFIALTETFAGFATASSNTDYHDALDLVADHPAAMDF
jgi:hypothetical protein